MYGAVGAAPATETGAYASVARRKGMAMKSPNRGRTRRSIFPGPEQLQSLCLAGFQEDHAVAEPVVKQLDEFLPPLGSQVKNRHPRVARRRYAEHLEHSDRRRSGTPGPTSARR
jgi:hypothetical protein